MCRQWVEQEDGTVDFKETLNLPRTKFKMRANLRKREPEILAQWETQRVYAQALEARSAGPRFVLHDGPPYANGKIHYGHILNKVLKDIIVKHRTMTGYYTLYRPGWDCHGLPIEIHVDRSLGARKENLSQVEIRQACRDYALQFVDTQREEFKRLGCFGTWDHPYLTLDNHYEATIVRELGNFIKNGYLYRGRKPVYWCGSCKTALAEAEVEYKDRRSPSIYVKLPLVDDPAFLDPKLTGKKTHLVIWTTTPWTIPANLAVVVWPDYPYVALEIDGEYYVVAEALVDHFLADCNLEAQSRFKIDAQRLEGRRYRHPLMEPQSENDFKVWFAPHVTLEQGTGLVHTAPGHGAEDYRVGLEHELRIFAPVDDRGCFTEEVARYAGGYVHETNPTVIDDLIAQQALLNPAGASIEHSYPHCWRCKNPIVFRATPQWFVDLDHEGFRRRALEEIDRTRWIPHWGHDRIFGMVESRPDWCLSRQRVWGVPLPLVYCTQCKEPLLSHTLAEHIATLFETHGSDVWFAKEPAELIPAGMTCPACGSSTFAKETDIVDVWFESGVSWAAVCENQSDLGVPVDLYLEGSDQHRGWFHSALLTGVATRDKAPYKAVLTHGFVVDDKGQPYSKTLKNYEPPEKILNRLGAEIFRLWVASEDYRNDIRISDEIIKRLSEGYRRIRNTCRFMLGNLSDFDPDTDAVAPKAFTESDRWVLSRLEHVLEKISNAYENFEFHKVYHALLEFASVDLSAFYLDIAKDRLYCEAPRSTTRRAAQTVIYELVRAVAMLAAPILSFTAEDIWTHLPHRSADPPSVHLALLPKLNPARRDPKLEEVWNELKLVRQAVTRAMEPFRAAKHHSLDGRVIIRPAGEFQRNVLQAHKDDLADLFIVSGVELASQEAEPTGNAFDPSERETELEPRVTVSAAPGEKCPRCWKVTPDPVENEKWGRVCSRCNDVLNTLAKSQKD
jgi:isoleucyl-tRNA synthetase